MKKIFIYIAIIGGGCFGCEDKLDLSLIHI